jgi:thiosulfate/3-mercaptopyruvate sulfurtransferase
MQVIAHTENVKMLSILSRRLVGAAAAIMLGLGLAVPSPASAVELPGPLVDPEWLADRLGDDGLVILDVRPGEALEGEHIPGARIVSFEDLRMEREADGMMLTRMSLTGPAFQRLMRRTGVDATDSVVVTWAGSDPDAVSNAAYLYWQLKYYGHDRVALLDGGNSAWRAADFDVTDEVTPEGRGSFVAGPGRDELLATTELVDTRPLAFHIGLEQRDYVFARGHIPGSDLFPFAFYTTGEDQHFRSREELRGIANDLGLELGRPIIAYCNSGHASASGWFVLSELLGERAALYDGSLHAWTKMGGAMTTYMHP